MEFRHLASRRQSGWFTRVGDEPQYEGDTDQPSRLL
jgi:hypothetical protein